MLAIKRQGKFLSSWEREISITMDFEQATRAILAEAFLRLRRMENGLSLADLMQEKVKVRYVSIRWD